MVVVKKSVVGVEDKVAKWGRSETHTTQLNEEREELFDLRSDESAHQVSTEALRRLPKRTPTAEGIRSAVTGRSRKDDTPCLRLLAYEGWFEDIDVRAEGQHGGGGACRESSKRSSGDGAATRAGCAGLTTRPNTPVRHSRHTRWHLAFSCSLPRRRGWLLVAAVRLRVSSLQLFCDPSTKRRLNWKHLLRSRRLLPLWPWLDSLDCVIPILSIHPLLRRLHLSY